MEQFINLEPWWRFGAALFIGALIGIEREFVQQHAEQRSFAGIRTFSFIALFGALAAYISRAQGEIVFIVAYGGYVLLVAGNRVAMVVRDRSEGMTTEVVALATPLLGALVIWDHPNIAAALSVVIALLLSLKFPLHNIARRMSIADLRATLQFGLLAVVVLPLLPNQALGPFGVLNPFQIWLLVVFVSGISFLGYLLMKLLGPERGTGLAGLFGGLVSSTAATVSFADRSRQDPRLAAVSAIAIVLASTVMFPRMLIEILVVNSRLVASLWLPVTAMLGAGVLVAIILWRGRPSAPDGVSSAVELGNPLRITSAVGFALLFAIVLVVVKVANESFGTAGLYLASGLSGLTGVDTITLSASGLAARGQIEPQAAAGAIVLAALVNTAAKAALASFLGPGALRRTILWAFGAMLIVGILVGLFTVWAPI
ncbi:MAG: MgtC/SapB family protein [Anaerolineales bacterium]|jgi:uncharacterized membrane protein (DUF4010 family)